MKWFANMKDEFVARWGKQGFAKAKRNWMIRAFCGAKYLLQSQIGLGKEKF